MSTCLFLPYSSIFCSEPRDPEKSAVCKQTSHNSRMLSRHQHVLNMPCCIRERERQKKSQWKWRHETKQDLHLEADTKAIKLLCVPCLDLNNFKVLLRKSNDIGEESASIPCFAVLSLPVIRAGWNTSPSCQIIVIPPPSLLRFIITLHHIASQIQKKSIQNWIYFRSQ